MKAARPRKAVDPLLEALGARVRAARQALGWTLAGLADRGDLSLRFVSDLEAGRANISVLNLARVAQALGVATAALLEGRAPATAPPPGVVALLGLRGAGKSTVGRRLAQRLEVPFFELDRLVEAEAGMNLAELFAIHGEGYYRQQELAALRRFLGEHPRAVLATGGGLVASAEAYRLLLERTRTVWLRASPREHWERVVAQGDLRPMANRPQAMAELKRRLEEREPLYARAQRSYLTSGRSVESVVAAVASDLVKSRSA